MEKISIQNIQVGNSTNSITEYDSNFIVLLPHTIITKDILAIFEQTYLNALITKKPLSLKEDIEYLFHEDDDRYDAELNKKEIRDTKNEIQFIDEYNFFKTDDPYIISKAILEYNALYEYAHTIYSSLYKTGRLKYKDVQAFVCNEIVPKIKKCPYIYLAIGHLPQEINKHTATEIGFKCLLLTLAILEQDKTQQAFFLSIDKRIEISICAFVSYVSVVSIEQQINKRVTVTEEKVQEILFKMSANILYKKHFPSYITEVISNMRPYRSKTTKKQYQETNNEIHIVADFLTIVNYYIQSITVKHNTPFQTIKTIIDDRYNFSTENIKLFTRSIGIIPIGSHVKLRNGCHAIIRRFPKDSPQYPEVHLVTNVQGNPHTSLIHIKTQKNEFNITEISSYETSIKMTETYLHMLKSKYK